MLVRKGDSPFVAFRFVDQPGGVNEYYKQVAAEQRQREQEAQELAQYKDVDPGIFDDEAITMAKDQGISWKEFVLRGLRIHGETSRSITMLQQSRREGYALAQRLGFNKFDGVDNQPLFEEGVYDYSARMHVKSVPITLEEAVIHAGGVTLSNVLVPSPL